MDIVVLFATRRRFRRHAQKSRGPEGEEGLLPRGQGLREGDPFMVHVTCDCCHKELFPGDDHFVVKVEAFAVHDPLKLTEADLDEDHMEEVSKLLCELEDGSED